MRHFRLPTVCALMLMPVTTSAQQSDLAVKVSNVLQSRCYSCHGKDGSVEGGMNYILDLNRLVQRGKIIPGKAEASPIYKRMANGSMPPAEANNPVTEPEKKIVKEWIDSGAGGIATPTRTAITDAQVREWILADLDKIDRRSRRFMRYFTLGHLYNAGLSDDELTTYRNAISKVINSLSWHPKIRNPEPIDANKTVLRIDLRWYMWDSVLWNRILIDYPYGILDDTATSRAIAVTMANRMPIVRGDWFAATACRPPLYVDLLQLPSNLTELERQLRIDANVNISQERVMRVGFTGSGISKNNRVLERHDSIHGYYWRTYDFDEVQQNLVERGQLLPDRKNIFAYPLGPGNLDNNFQHAGGEAIFSLPNGMQGFMLVNANNIRIDKGPIQIVSDPKRPDRAVETGISCMSCHIPGIIAKADQIHDHLLKNPKVYSKADGDLIRSLYPPKETTLAQMEEDSKRYQAAVAQTGAKVAKYEPVSTVTIKYEADLDLISAAAEVGLAPEAFKTAIRSSEILTRNLGGLQVPGGAVNRQVWVQTFGDLVRDLKLGLLFQGAQATTSLQDNTGDIDPLETRGSQANQMVFTADGKTAIIAGADRTVRVHEVEGRRDLKRFIGHLGSVWCVALSPDGKTVLSGGNDQILRLWDVSGGRPIRTFEGHEALITAVAFVPNSQQAISAGYDGAIILWDLDKGTEIRRFGGKTKYIQGLTISPDGSELFVAADKIVARWDLKTGQPKLELSGHADSVNCVITSPDGTQVVTGSDDRTMRLWDLKTGKTTQTFSGHEGPVKSIAWLTQPAWLLSTSGDGSVRLWQTATGKEIGAFRKHGAPVVSARFTANGRQTVSGDQAGGVLVWNLDKFYPTAPKKEPETPKYPDPPKPMPSVLTPPKVELIPMPTVKTSNADELNPALKMPFGGTVGTMLISANGKWLYVLNVAENKILRIDTTTLKVTHEMLPKATIEAMAFSADAKLLITIGTLEGKCVVNGFDAATLKESMAYGLPIVPFDLFVGADEVAYISGTLEGRSFVVALPLTGDNPIQRWETVGGQAFPRFMADQKRLLVRSGEGDGRLESWSFGADGKRLPKITAVFGTADSSFAGEPFVLPSGKAMMFRSGAIVRLSPGQEDDLQTVRTIEPFVSATADTQGSIFTITTTGDVKAYVPGTWAEKGSYRLRGIPYQVLYHAGTGRLYVAMLDPSSLTSRPRVRGFGEIWAIDMKPTVAAK